jgi:hypothetical protein
VILLLSRFSHNAARLFFVLLFTAAWAGGSENISPLGQAPDWSALEKYQETMTHDDSRDAQEVYCTRGVSADLIQSGANVRAIDKDERKVYAAAPNDTSKKRFADWRQPSAFPARWSRACGHQDRSWGIGGPGRREELVSGRR